MEVLTRARKALADPDADSRIPVALLVPVL